MEEYLINILKELAPVLTVDQGRSKETNKADFLEGGVHFLYPTLI